ncbi:hypothetical protein C7S17_5267 [Burkholderia thailandensis]|nr:hypothetical protein [Burkholderia thailandensis]
MLERTCGQRRPARGETPASSPAAPPKRECAVRFVGCGGTIRRLCRSRTGGRRSSIARIPRAPALPASRPPPHMRVRAARARATPPGKQRTRCGMRPRTHGGPAARAERPLKTAAGDRRLTRHARRQHRPTIEQDMPGRPSAHAAPFVSSANAAF